MPPIVKSPLVKLLYVLALVAIAVAVYRYVEEERRGIIDFAETGGSVNELLMSRASWDGIGEPPYPHFEDGEALWRYHLPREVANLFFFCDRPGEEYDPWTGVRRSGGMSQFRTWSEHPKKRWKVVTNSIGLRNAREVRTDQPELRILATGDSHTDGVCWNGETWPLVLRDRLRARKKGLDIEVLNAGKGGYGFYNYLGVIEKFAELKPDAFIVCVYGGNDFEGVLGLWHYFRRTLRPMGTELYVDEVDAAKLISPAAMAQSFLSIKYFAEHPDQEAVALEASLSISREIVARCEELDCHPIFVYLPALPDVRYDEAQTLCDDMLEAMKLEPEDLDAHRRLADGWKEGLRADGVDVVDLRSVFRRAEGKLYWTRDHHINVDAQDLIARALAPLVEKRFELR